jgi:hypothetical protein
MIVLSIDFGDTQNEYSVENPGVKLSYFINGDNGDCYAPESTEFKTAIQNAFSKGHEVRQ